MPSIRARNLILITIVTAALLGLAYSFFIEPRRLITNRQELPVKGLDPAFDGLKVVAIGDIHGGSNYVTEDRIRALVAASNAERPDLVVLLGDYVSEEFGRPVRLKMPVDVVANALAGLQARLGVYAVLGNHDGIYGQEDVARERRRVGIKVLQNELDTLEIHGRPLRIVGFKDHMSLKPQWAEVSSDAKEFLKDSKGQIIVLEHSPDVLPMITGPLSIAPDLRLILASHTHGGQVWLPVIGSPIVPSSYGQKYRSGHVRENDVDMFVTTGIGTSVLPFRFLVPPEIAVLTLRAE